MSTLAIDGLSSGFDTTAIIEAILDAQVRGPVDQLETRIENHTEKLAAFQTLSANMLSVRMNTQTLSDASLFSQKEASSSDTSILTATATQAANTGGFSIKVNNLAQAVQLSSDFFSSASEALDLSGSFVLNGRTVEVSTTDTLTTLANQINNASAGVNASIVETAPGQVKLVLTATETGVGTIEMRDVGPGSLLEDLTLVDTDPAQYSYDYTVNASSRGAISKAYANLTDNAGVAGSFTIRDAGGQYTVNVDGANAIVGGDTVQDVIDKINNAAAGTNISAEAVEDASGEWHIEIRSETGIPTRFEDPDDVLQGLEIVEGIQSEDFSDTTTAVGTLLGLTAPPGGQFRITGGDSIDVDVTVELSTDSLQEIVEKINTAAAAAGSDVTAEIKTVGSTSRLNIKSASGNPEFSNDANNILKTLGVVDVAFKNLDQDGENAEFLYNGVTVNRTRNLVNDLVEGVSLALISESTSNVTVSINEDLSNVTSVVQDFVTSYNTARSFISEKTFYDATTGEAGLLLGDSTVRTIENMLADLISTRVPKMPGVELSELNEGAGVKLGSIKIKDRGGNEAEIDLSSADTVDDVIFLISNYPTVNVRAEVNSTGTGINIIDENENGVGFLEVEEVGGGTTAEDLGILGRITSSTLTGSRIYEGGSITANQFGIELTAAGTLSFDSTKFENALNNEPELVRNLFTAEKVGLGDKMTEQLDFITQPNTGLIALRTEGLTDSIEQFQKSIKRFEERSEKLEETLRRKYTALEVTMAESQNLMSYLTQQSGLIRND